MHEVTKLRICSALVVTARDRAAVEAPVAIQSARISWVRGRWLQRVNGMGCISWSENAGTSDPETVSALAGFADYHGAADFSFSPTKIAPLHPRGCPHSALGESPNGDTGHAR